MHLLFYTFFAKLYYFKLQSNVGGWFTRFKLSFTIFEGWISLQNGRITEMSKPKPVNEGLMQRINYSSKWIKIQKLGNPFVKGKVKFFSIRLYDSSTIRFYKKLGRQLGSYYKHKLLHSNYTRWKKFFFSLDLPFKSYQTGSVEGCGYFLANMNINLVIHW